MINKTGKEKISILKDRLIVTYTVLALCLYGAACAYITSRSERVINEQTMDNTASAAMQTRQNIQLYVRDIERFCAAFFEDGESREFYPTGEADAAAQERERLNDIGKQLLDAGFMRNYCDWGILYDNGESAGSISRKTSEILGEDSFEKFRSMADENGGSVWYTDGEEQQGKIFYLKTVNPHALMIISAYTDELALMLDVFNENSSMNFYLLDGSGSIIYRPRSTNSETLLTEKQLSELFEGRSDVTVTKDGVTATIAECSNGWRICCVNDRRTSALGYQTQNWIVAIGAAAAVLLVFAGSLISAPFTDPPAYRRRRTSPDSYDRVTGLISGFYLEEEIADRIERSMVGSTLALILVKIKDYETIRERLGSDYADAALKKMGDMLLGHFRSEDTVGIGENGEFMILADFTDFDLFKANEQLKEKCRSVCAGFENFYMGENDDRHRLYAAMGVCVYPDGGKTFEELYECASAALESSLALEKDSCIFYNSTDKKEVRHEK